MTFKSDFSRIYTHLMNRVPKWLRRIYVLSFNCYAWYWLYRAIFVQHNTNFEDYLLWFFTTVGMYFFVLDNEDRLFFKVKK
jgi:hypothetical protein